MNNIQFILNTDKIVYKNIGDYHLADTFECGQAFRFDPYMDGYKGFIEKQLCHITIRDEKGTAIPSSVGVDNAVMEVRFFHTQPTEDLAVKTAQFLALDTDYTALKKQFAQNETMAEAIKFAPGIRVLNQDFFETLITFIISQNNNIPRIKQLCDRISENYGTKVGDTFAFPTSELTAAKNVRNGFGGSRNRPARAAKPRDTNTVRGPAGPPTPPEEVF